VLPPYDSAPGALVAAVFQASGISPPAPVVKTIAIQLTVSLIASGEFVGIPMILREVEDGKSKPYSFSGMQKIVQRMRKEIGLPKEFTLDACRHGGMTELEEAELTEGQGRALSAHRTRESYARYAKRTEARMLSATRKRHAHMLANQLATSVQNATDDSVQNEKSAKAISG
jgi:hypothetical protein